MSLKEQEPEVVEYVRLEGNSNIQTPLGVVSVDVNPQSLRNELVQAIDQYHSDLSLRQRGREMAQRIVMIFNRQALTGFLVPKVEKKQKEITDPNSFTYKYLEAEKKVTLGERGQALGSFFLNPVQAKESIFYLNIPLLIEGKNVQSPLDFEEEFRHLWLHERHHFVQNAQPSHYLSLAADRELMFSTWVLGMGGLLVGGGVAGYKGAKFAGERIDYFRTDISRRDFIKLGGVIGGALIGTGGGLVGLYRGIGKLNYTLPFTVEGQAEAAAYSSNYSSQDFQQTFQVAIV